MYIVAADLLLQTIKNSCDLLTVMAASRTAILISLTLIKNKQDFAPCSHNKASSIVVASIKLIYVQHFL